MEKRIKSDVVVWRGERWYRYKDYHKNRYGKLLHREKYQDAYGPVADDIDIHHKDGDKSNHDIGNLEPLSRGDHIRHHPRGISLWDTDRRRQNTKENIWGKRQPVSLVCPRCSKEFQSVGMRAKFCSPACKAWDFRQRNPGYFDKYRRRRQCEKTG